MWAWATAFFSKNLWSILSVIADILVVLFVGYSIWNVLYPKPTNTQNETAGKIYNYTIYPDKLDFAVGKLGGFEFLSYHSYPASTVKKVTTIAAVKSVVGLK